MAALVKTFVDQILLMHCLTGARSKLFTLSKSDLFFKVLVVSKIKAEKVNELANLALTCMTHILVEYR